MMCLAHADIELRFLTIMVLVSSKSVQLLLRNQQGYAAVEERTIYRMYNLADAIMHTR
jgi:hypothetical protein